MSAVRVAVLHAPGTNRDDEAARAFHLAGATSETVHVLELGRLDGPAAARRLGEFDAVLVPGGFSYGDALGAGTRLALETGDLLAGVAATGRPVLGICNGFQVLVRAGLLPGPAGTAQELTLTHNTDGRFVCRWVTLQPPTVSRAALHADADGVIACPVAHGEGRIAVADPDLVAHLAANGNVLLRYVEGTNPNGSVDDIAGLVDDAGTVWGLMPHPEDHVTDAQNAFPDRPGRSGLPLFRSFVALAVERRRARPH
ncbi:MAG: phosphoribosylformylglycinamidine synthase I [Actinobacteria bacterium]|nr:phosphoribosylformylglycinamidine synthase I [Actinomycetota bacterium]